MQPRHKAIGILGGTFDPIHIGHLRMALEVTETLKLESVHLIPSYQPMYRATPVATPLQRLQMVEHAIIQEPKLIADDREIRRGGATYTIDTLIEMRNAIPDTPLCLLIGIDAFLDLPNWHRFQEIFSYAHIVVAYRPLYQLPKTGIVADLIEKYRQHNLTSVHQTLAGSLLFCTMTQLEISATNIRKQFELGNNPRYLIPDRVYDYIQAQHIYNKVGQSNDT
jgi:nicotinate-nucleotide adenylyltransferase